MANKRPEHLAPPEIFYNDDEAQNSHIISIQSEMTERSLELLALPDDTPSLILDIGCGSGLSGEVITDSGHYWIGFDISQPMLDVAKERQVSGDLILQDMGKGVPFRPGTFDGAISISALQWLCHSNSNEQIPRKRLLYFFQTLYGALARGARAVFQFYPENADQSELISQQAMRAGFTGGIVVDFPNSTKAKKIFLVLTAGGSTQQQLPRALDTNDSHVSNAGRSGNVRQDAKARPIKGSRAWIEAKKERARKQGREVRPSTKYTGRKRRRL